MHQEHLLILFGDVILMSPACLLWQVRLVINEKGLLCEERDVSLPLTEHKEPWFMRLNLGEEVPVFIHGDTIVSDYNQIIDYIETNFAGGITSFNITKMIV